MFTFEQGAYPPEADGTLSVELTEDQLHVEEGNGTEDQHEGVGDKESTCHIAGSVKRKNGRMLIVMRVGGRLQRNEEHCG